MTGDLLFWAMLALMPIIFYVQVLARRRQAERAKAVERRDAANVIARFQRTRLICAWFSLLPALLGMAIMMLSVVLGGPLLMGGTLGMNHDRWLPLGFGMFVSGLAFGLIVYRCPLCNAMPTKRTQRGVLLNPTVCGSCKTRLRNRASDDA